MKRRTVCLAALSLFLLTGCSGAKATISNADETLFTVDSTTVTAGDEYNLIKKANGGSMTLELAKRAVYDNIVPATDEMKKAAEEEYKTLTTYYADLETQLSSIGYETKEDYIENVMLPEQQKTELQKQYFTDNKKAIRKQYKPSLATVLRCDSEDIAKEALEALKKGDDISTVYSKYSSADSTFTNEDIVVTTSNSDVPTRMVNKLYKADKKGLIEEVFTKDDGSGFAYIAILNTHDYDKNADEFREAITSQSSTIETEMFKYYFEKLGFEIYDQDIFDYLKVNNPDFLIKYPEIAQKAQEESK